MQLGLDNYYTREADLAYMSCSQFKSFMECPAAAMATLRGEYKQATTDAMLIGSYVDAYFSGDLDTFRTTHPELFKKDGTLKSEYIKADQAIERISRDPMMLKYLSGQPQVVMMGQISGIPFKIRMDSYHPGQAIVDLKYMKDFKPIWKQGTRMHWIEAWQYDLQGAIYREIERQNQTGGNKSNLPFIIAAASKEEPCDIALLGINDQHLKDCLAIVKGEAPRFDRIKKGEDEAYRCERCAYCRQTKIITSVLDYTMEDLYE